MCYNNKIENAAKSGGGRMAEFGTRQLNGFIAEYPTSEKLRNDKDITVAVLRKMPLYAEYVGEELKKDADVALAAVRSDGRALRFFDASIRSDKTVAVAAVENFYKSYAFVSGKARTSAEVLIAVAKSGGDAIELLPKEALDSVKLCLIAIERNPKAVKYFSERVRGTERVAKAALSKDRTTVSLLGQDAFSSDEVFSLAVRMSAGDIAPRVLGNDTPVGIFYAMEARGMTFNLASQNVNLFTLDREKLKVVLKCARGAIPRKNELFRKYIELDDKEIISMMIDSGACSPSMLADGAAYASKNRKIRVLPVLLNASHNNRKRTPVNAERISLIKSLKRGSALGVERFLEHKEEYAEDKEIVFLAVIADGRILPRLKDSKYYGCEELTDLCLENYVVKNSDDPILKNLSDVKLTKKQARLACTKDGRNYFWLPEEYKTEREVVAAAVRTEKEIYDTLSEELKSDPEVYGMYRR